MSIANARDPFEQFERDDPDLTIVNTPPFYVSVAPGTMSMSGSLPMGPKQPTHQMETEKLFSVKGMVCVITGGGTGRPTEQPFVQASLIGSQGSGL